MKEIATQYQVAAGTAHRAVALLAERGHVVVARGKRAEVARRL
jgi:DNA-binding GntR family transcriptional regulator